MRKERIIFLLAAGFLLAGQVRPAYAQEDSLSVFGLKMQRRVVPADQPFTDPAPGRNLFLRALENTSISLMGGYHRWLDRDIGSGPVAGLSVSRWITPRHGLRLEAGTGYLLDNEGLSKVELFPDIRLSHLFNLSAFLDGYDPSRTGFLYTLAGAGLAWRPSGPGSWNVQLGIGYSVHVLRGTDLFIEPSFELNGNSLLQQQDGNWRGYFSGFRGLVGLSYRIDRWNTLLPPKTEHKWFVEASGGPAWLLASPYLSKVGYHVSLGIGERITPTAGVRLSGVWTQTFLFANPQYSASYSALRLEGLLDLAGRDNSPFGLALIAGPEAGLVSSSEENPVIFGGYAFPGNRSFYVGATTGIQLRARIYRRIYAVLEPRVSIIPYAARDRSSSRADNQVDVVLSTNLGVHYDMRSTQERKAAQERARLWWQRTKPKLNLTVSVEGSYFRPLGTDFSTGPLASLSLGTWLTESFGTMLSAGAGYLQYLDEGVDHVKTTDFSAIFLLNLTRLAKGARPDRQLNLSLLAGAGYMQPWKETWNGSPVFRTGLDFRMHVFPQTDLVIRPEINVLKAPSEKWTPALRGSFGLGYSIGGRESVARFKDAGKEWFFTLGPGIRFEFSGREGTPPEHNPLGEYRLCLSVGRKYSSRLDWRLSLSYLSQLYEQDMYDFLHQLRFASLNLDALYHLTDDDREDRKWSLSLVGGPEIGYLHRGNSWEGIVVGSGLLMQGKMVAPYLGLSGGIQLKYRFVDGLSVYLEPRYSLAPYVAWNQNQTENYYSHLLGADFGLEYTLGRGRSRAEGTSADRVRKGAYLPFTFFQLTGTTYRPLGRGYGNGPLVSLGIGHRFKGASGALVEIGLGYFRDNQYSVGEDKKPHYPEHLVSADFRASYLLSLNRLVSLSQEDVPMDLSLIAGIGYLIPEFRQDGKGTFTVHGGLDIRMPVFHGTDFIFQPQLEVIRRDPHNLVSGKATGVGAAFRGTFGLSYNLSGQGPLPARDPGENWFVTLSGGYQYETGQMADQNGTGISHNEYRIALSVGRRYTDALSLRAGVSFSERFPLDESFLHSLRYTSVNLDILYDLLAGKAAGNRVSLSLLAGPDVGLFNKEYRKDADYESPMALPFKIGRYYHEGLAAYLGLSAGVQVRVKVFRGLSLFLEPRYSLIPYVAILNPTTARNMASHLGSLNLGIQYSFE